MPKWVNRLDLRDIFEQAGNDEISPRAFCAEVANRLEALELVGATSGILADREYLVESFRIESKTESSFDNVDDIMEGLRDWGDQLLSGNIITGRKLCWIATSI